MKLSSRHNILIKSNVFIWLSLVCFITLMSCTKIPEEQVLHLGTHVEENRDYIIITPNWDPYSKTGLVFYPGALVDPHSYIEPLSQFAMSGLMHQIVIIKMPNNLAILDADKGKWMYDRFPAINRWVVAGHSLGGVSASKLVYKYSTFFHGLALLAATSQKSSDLSTWSQTTLSIRGENDLLVTDEEVKAKQKYLPPAVEITSIDDFPMDRNPKTVYYTIPGGNHANFGHYGDQKGDGVATISRQEQIEEMVKILQKWFDAYHWDK